MFFAPSLTTFVGSVALSGLLFGVGGFLKGCDYEKDKATAALLKATQEARETETNWGIAVQAQEELHAEEIARINAARLAAERELRNRAARLPEASRAACQGATGAELSGRDASDLVSLATRADELRAALWRCQAWAETVTSPPGLKP